MPWFIVWPDGRSVDPKTLPTRTDSHARHDDPLKPFYDIGEHRHHDGSYHLVGQTKEEAIRRCQQKGADELPLYHESGRLPVVKAK